MHRSVFTSIVSPHADTLVSESLLAQTFPFHLSEFAASIPDDQLLLIYGTADGKMHVFHRKSDKFSMSALN